LKDGERRGNRDDDAGGGDQQLAEKSKVQPATKMMMMNICARMNVIKDACAIAAAHT
jgi:hypothetical protein